MTTSNKMKQLRILVISNYYPPFELGGWEQLTHDVSLLLSERGHTVHVLTSNFRSDEETVPDPSVSRTLHLESLDQAHYHVGYTFSQRRHETENKLIVSRAVAEFEPDIVFINGLWNMSRSVAWQAEQLCQGRVVYYVASTWPTDVDAHTAYWSSPTVNPLLRIPKKLAGKIAEQVLVPTVKSSSLAFPRVLCVSAFMQKYMINEAGVPSEQTHVVHNGIDITEFSLREDDPSKSGPLQLLYAGGFWSIKGVDTAVAAIGILVNELDETDAHLTLVGAGHPDYTQSLKDIVSAQKIERYVTFSDRIPREQMPQLLQQHDVLLFPSTGPEALARMTQEAMAAGLVVIGTTTGGTPEILEDGVNGLTFIAGDAHMLAHKIAQLLGDPAARQRFARAARQTVEERFTFERMVDELEAHFYQIIDGVVH